MSRAVFCSIWGLFVVMLLPGAALAEKRVNPCELLTQAEVHSLLAVPVGVPIVEDHPPTGGQTCIYPAEQKSAEPVVHVNILQQAYLNEDMKDAGQTPDMVFYGGMDALVDFAIPVEGIGDEAFFDGSSLHLLVKEDYITLNAGGEQGGENATLSTLKEMAGIILPRFAASK